MASHVHPKAFRIKGLKDWSSRGFYENDFSSYLEEDFEIRKFLKEKIGKLGVGKVVIERFAGKITIVIYTSRPGLIIGRGGKGVEELKNTLEAKISKGKEAGKRNLRIEIKEIKNPWVWASLVAENIAVQVEGRMPYRRVLKRMLDKIISQKEVKGVRLEVAGRLNGISIARTEWLSEGLMPRQTLRANIDYATSIAYCTYGTIGVKVWIYKGEEFE